MEDLPVGEQVAGADARVVPLDTLDQAPVVVDVLGDQRLGGRAALHLRQAVAPVVGVVDLALAVDR